MNKSTLELANKLEHVIQYESLYRIMDLDGGTVYIAKTEDEVVAFLTGYFLSGGTRDPEGYPRKVWGTPSHAKDHGVSGKMGDADLG